jgi:hypothetical protein
MPNEIELLITARDEASRTLAAVQTLLDRALKGTGQSVEDVDRRTESWGRQLRASTQAVRAISTGLISELNPALAGAVAQFQAGVTGASRFSVAIAGITVGLAAAGAGLTLFISRLKDAQKFQADLAFAARSGDLGALRGLMADAARQSELFNIQASQARQQITGWRSALEVVVSYWQTVLGKQPAQFTEEIKKAGEELKKLLPFEAARVGAEGLVKELGAFAGYVGTQAERAEALLDLEAFQRRMAQLQTISVDVAVGLEKAARARAALLRKAAEARGGPKEELDLIAQGLDLEIKAIGTAALGQFEGLRERTRTGEISIRSGLLQIDTQRAQILTQIHGLTQSERAEAELQLVEAQRLLKVEQARGIPQLEAVANLEAQVRSAALLRQELERLDPVAGLDKSFREIGDDWGALGRRMEDLSRGTAANIQQLFARTLRGEAIGKDFANAMLRTITDQIAQYLTGTLAGAIRQILPGGAGGFPLGSAATAALNVTGAPPQTLAALQQQGYQITAGTGGQSYAVPIVGYPSGGPAMIPSGLAGYGGEFGASGQAPATVQGQGLTYGQVGGYVLAGAGAALAAYGVYQSTQRGQNTSYFEGAVAGGITGAGYGGMLGGGYGAAAGAVIGIGIGIAGADVSQARYARYKRRQQRARQAQRILREIDQALRQPVLIEDMLRVRLVSGNSVGGLLLAMAQTAGDAELVAYLRERGMSPEGFNWEHLNSLQELLGNIGDATVVGDFLTGVLSALQGLQEREEGALFGYVEREPTAGVVRTTYLPSTALGRVPADRQDIFVSTQLLRNQGYDDDFIAYLIRRIKEVNTRKDMVVDLSATDFLAVT